MLIKILPAFPFNKPVRKKVTKTVSKTTIGTLYLNGEVILKSGITIHKLELLDKNGEEFPKKYPKQLYPTLIWSSHNEPMKANYSNYPTLIHKGPFKIENKAYLQGNIRILFFEYPHNSILFKFRLAVKWWNACG
eukprot:jgi/Bigna1/137422/aug1.39_g12130